MKSNLRKQIKRESKLSRVNNKVVERVDVSERDQLIIDSYYNNGYNKAKAVQAVCTNVTSYSAAYAIFNGMIKKKEVQAYVEQKQLNLRAKTNLQEEQVTRELINWAYSDATEFIGLSVDEIKSLPPAIRRCIQSFELIEVEEINRKGNPVKTTKVKVKLIDKANALRDLSKHIGYYEADNKQKNKVIDLSKTSADDLNALLRVFESQKNTQPKTIDI